MTYKGTANFRKTTVTATRSVAGGTLTVADATVFDGDNALPDRPVRLVVTRSDDLVTILLATSRSDNILTVEPIEETDAQCLSGDDVKLAATSATFEDIHTTLDSLFLAVSDNQTSFLVSGGGVAWVTGYQYRVSASTYYINGTLYTSPESTVTLSEADATYDRFDVIALNTSSTSVAITGTAAPNPNVPDIDPQTQLQLSIVQVNAATTEPESTSDNLELYLENTEWTASVSNASINLNSTSNPRTGSKTIEGTNVANSHYFQLTDDAIDITTKTSLVFYLRSKGSWGNKSLAIRFANAGVIKGSTISVANNTYGFNSSLTGAYQQIVIPISHFAIASGTLIDQVRFTITGGGSAIGFYLDDITIQAETVIYSPSYLTQDQTDARYAQRAQNLSDLTSASTARTNLGLDTRLLRAFGFGASGEITTGQKPPSHRADTAYTLTQIDFTLSAGTATATVESSINDGSDWATIATVAIASGKSNTAVASGSLTTGTLLRVNYTAASTATDPVVTLYARRT
jgi:hypothetical protein